MMKTRRYPLVALSRWFGRQVCRLRGHDRYYPGAAYDSRCAYACIRCGELDRPLESLPAMTPDEFGDWDDLDFHDEAAHEHARRWISWLPWPKWL